MRHNQNGRRFRDRNNNNNRGNHGGGNHNHGGGHSHGGQRRINPRVQIFDSNGPDVRVRGNAIQINEKYLALAKDAAAAGDRVLAESYLQHAEHYQRMLNEANEEMARHQAQFQQQQPQQNGEGDQPAADGSAQGLSPQGASEQPDVGMHDLDQGFLVGRSNAPAPGTGDQPVIDGGATPAHPARRQHPRGPRPQQQQAAAAAPAPATEPETA